MKAVVYHPDRGLVYEVRPDPDIDEGEVLLAVIDVGFCGSDHSIIESGGAPDGLILGHEVSAVIVEVGSAVSDLKPGQRMIVRPTFCGRCRECRLGKPQLCSASRKTIGIGGEGYPGGFAEYIKALPSMLIPIPAGVDSKNAALAELFAVSWHGMQCVGALKGPVLVVGAGAVGLSLISLLKLHRIGPIMVSEPRRVNSDTARRIGADLLVDPASEDLRKAVFLATNGIGAETVFECSGRTEQVQLSMDTVASGGTVCLLSVILEQVQISPISLTFKEIRLTAAYGNTHEENRQCLSWMAESRLDAQPLISDLISLEQLPDAYRERIRTGKSVKTVVQIGSPF
jgi:threonine dehydrogenase-like Zn-dependent dehydrogenase